MNWQQKTYVGERTFMAAIPTVSLSLEFQETSSCFDQRMHKIPDSTTGQIYDYC